MPNVAAVVIVVASLLFSAAILIEAALSFLGVGVPAPAVSWGGMLGGENRNFLIAAPWMALAPGIALTAVVLAMNLVATRWDVLDPRLRGSR